MKQIPNIEEEQIVNLREWWELQSIIDAIQTGRPIHIPDIDFLEKLAKSISKTLHHQLQKAREEERERIEAVFKEHVPPHAMDLEDSVWLKRLLNKAFGHD